MAGKILRKRKKVLNERKRPQKKKKWHCLALSSVYCAQLSEVTLRLSLVYPYGQFLLAI
jgi:hypothetical protein